MLPFPLAEARRLLEGALGEDVGTGDVTTFATVPSNRIAVAELVAKEPLRLAGVEGFRLTFELLGGAVEWDERYADGEEVPAGEVILAMTGDARTLLTGERTALNFLQHLSGIATETARWAAELEGSETLLLDTRKTAPGMRAVEKYAVRVGGGRNHRFGLSDGVLIKENHIRAAGSIALAVEAAREFAPHTLKVEVEVTNLDELAQALGAGAEIVMLDNMTDADMAQAVKVAAGRALLEASGNMTLKRLKSVAATGVDFISSGAITHSARAVDISLLFRLP